MIADSSAARSPTGSDGKTVVVESASSLGSLSTRRRFLRTLSLGGSIILMPTVLAACGDDDNLTEPVPDPDPDPQPEAVTIDLSTDTGVLNFAYALEQLEAAYYTQVTGSFFAGATTDEQSVLNDLRDHEIVHRELFLAALGADAIPGLTPTFDSVDFGDRMSVLATARTFEDLGVAAYNGAGAALSNPDFLAVAGKIVSVEARHASVIRTLLGLNFAPEAFDAGMSPADVLTAADPFIENEITLQNA